MQLGELSEQLDEGSFAERVIRRGVEGNGRITRCKVLDVPCLEKFVMSDMHRQTI